MAGKQEGYAYRGYHIEEDSLEQLKKVSKETRLTLKDIVNDAIKEYLKNGKKGGVELEKKN